MIATKLLVTMCAASAILAVSSARAQPAPCYGAPTFVGDPPQVDEGYFASDIALDGNGDMAIIGEIFGDGLDPVINPINKSGTARIFSRPAGPWEEVQTIQHDTPEEGDNFGASVDISGSFAIVAAPGRIGLLGEIGAAYIFERNLNLPVTEQWSQQAVIFNPAEPPGTDNGFGGSLTRHETVGIDGRFAVVGASDNGGSGVVYVFNNSGGTWIKEFELLPPDPQLGAKFGYCVDISGTRVIVGAPYRDAGGTEAGKAYVFRRNVPSTPAWVLEDELVASPDAEDYDHFGWSVSIDGTRAIVGAPNRGLELLQSPPGFALVFRRISATEWVKDGESAKLTPSNGQLAQAFGYAVNISGSISLVGANSYNVGATSDVGTAYSYQRLASGWTEGSQFFSSGSPFLGDRVGETLALDGGEVFVGILSDEPTNSPPDFENSGSVLIGPWNCVN